MIDPYRASNPASSPERRRRGPPQPSPHASAVLGLLALVLLCLPRPAAAVCATVRIEIVQELTLERQAFDARLQIHNETTAPIEDLLVTVTFRDEAGTDQAALFFTSLSSTDGMTGSPDGTGTVPASTSADLHWLIIPAPGAGGETPDGVRYQVGATLSFLHNGSLETETMEPDWITVEPMPELHLDYFLTRYVIGDDPYTPSTEPPVPFTLGVRVRNEGYGPANDLSIASGQPEIVDNDLGLLIAFYILGSEVNGEPGSTSLTVDFGDLDPEEAGVARWSMYCTLSGEFISFEADYVHDDALGGEMTSLIEEVSTYFLVHDVLVDLDGRDDRRDFLAENGAGGFTVYESDNVDTAVAEADAVATSNVPSSSQPTMTLTCDPNTSASDDLFYVATTDPGNGQFDLVSVVRSDGTALESDNFWIAGHYDLDTHDTEYTLGIFDAGGLCEYVVTYNVPDGTDVDPPESDVIVLDPSSGESPVCVSSETNFLFTATDTASTVTGMWMKLDGDPADLTDYEAAISPFRFALRPSLGTGAHTLSYYATDASSNVESPHSLAVMVDDSAPTFASGPTASPSSFAPDAPESSSQARASDIGFQVDDDCGPVSILLEASAGSTFDASAVVSRLETEVDPGTAATVTWTGQDLTGSTLTSGTYALRLTATDPLGHETTSSTTTVVIDNALDSDTLSSAAGANQIALSMSTDMVVWQDDRDGDWDIYGFTLGGSEALLSVDAPEGTDQTDPAVSDDWVAWVDDRSGTPRIRTLCRGTLDQADVPLAGTHGAPALSGSTLVFEADLDGQWDIYSQDLDTGTVTRLTTDTADQRDPSISGDYAVFEDARHGADTEIYGIDVDTGLETRLTTSSGADQLDPVVAGNAVLWVQSSSSGSDLFHYDLGTGETRQLTRGSGDQSAVATDGTYFTYLYDGTELGRGTVAPGVSRLLSADGQTRLNPVVSGDFLAWSQLVGSVYQVQYTTTEYPDLELRVAKGFNLLSLPQEVTATLPTAHALLTAWGSTYSLTRIAQLGSDGAWSEVSRDGATLTGDDFSLTADRALVAYATAASTIPIETLARSPSVALVAGLNPLGVSSLPWGYDADALIDALGSGSVRWARRFDVGTGRFEAVAIDASDTVGDDFTLSAGEGLLVHATAPVAGWRP